MTHRYALRLVRRGRTVAVGTVRNRTIRLTVRRGRRGYARLGGTYTLVPRKRSVTLGARRIRFG